MGLLHLVEQDHGVGTPAHGLGELTALLVADVPGRSADQPGHRVLLGVLAHVDAHHGGLVVEQEVGQRLGQLGLADAGGAEEQERSGGPVRVGDPGARTPHRIRDGLDGLALPYEPLAESLLHVQQLLGLTLQHPPDGDPRPGRDDLGDVGLGDLVGDHAGGVRVGFLRVDELLLDDGDLPVQQLRGAPQVAGALRLVGLHAQRVDLFLEVADPVQPGLLLLPAGLQTAQLLLGVGEL